MDINVEALGKEILDGTKAQVGDAWDSWTDEEKGLVTRCTKRAAELTIRATAGENVTQAKAESDAQMANIQAAALGSVAGVIWNVVDDIIKKVVGVLKSGL